MNSFFALIFSPFDPTILDQTTRMARRLKCHQDFHQICIIWLYILKIYVSYD